VKAPSAIGTRVRQVREERGLTLKALADSMGVTSSLLSQIETDKVQPSLNTLYQLAIRLNLSIDALLQLDPDPRTTAGGGVPDGDGPVQRGADNPVLETTGGVRWERLAGGSLDGIDALLITYAPGSTSSSDGSPVLHEGHEFGLLLEGGLTLELGARTLHLGAGDSVHFETSQPHVYRNEAAVPARGVWFCVRTTGEPTNPRTSTPRGRSAGEWSPVDVLKALNAGEDW
jgi:transcriptional regulator with XRE-family HTH domain/quercetin dioxygenase-like cupin family protein